MTIEKQIEKVVLSYGARIRSQGSQHVDVEIETPTGSRASVTIDLRERRYGGYGFNPQGQTEAKFLSTTVAMLRLIELAQALWDLCGVAGNPGHLYHDNARTADA